LPTLPRPMFSVFYSSSFLRELFNCTKRVGWAGFICPTVPISSMY
jgi:hypothetical protein